MKENRVYPMAGLMTRYVAALGTINQPSVQDDGTTKWFDTLEVQDEDGEVWDAMLVESTEDEAPYKAALAAAGWMIVGRTITGAWRVKR